MGGGVRRRDKGLRGWFAACGLVGSTRTWFKQKNSSGILINLEKPCFNPEMDAQTHNQ